MMVEYLYTVLTGWTVTGPIWSVNMATFAKFLIISRGRLQIFFKPNPIVLQERSFWNDSRVSTGSHKEKESHKDQTNEEQNRQSRCNVPSCTEDEYAEGDENSKRTGIDIDDSPVLGCRTWEAASTTKVIVSWPSFMQIRHIKLLLLYFQIFHWIDT